MRAASEVSSHYYGDITRRILIIAGMLILLGIPVFIQYVPKPFITSIFTAIVFALVAGFTKPDSRTVTIITLVISMGAVTIFEWYLVETYSKFGTASTPFLLETQALALLFFFSLYYSAKTVRGMFIHRST